MEDFDKYLDQLVENFYDTGKVVLNEMKNSPEMTKLRRDYDSLIKKIEYGESYYQVEVDSLYSQWSDLTPYQKEDFENYNHDEFDLKLDDLDLSNVVSDDEIENDLNSLIRIGVGEYGKGEYQKSIDSYRKVIDTYTNLPDDIRSINFINDISTLNGWIKNTEKKLSNIEKNIKKNELFSNPNISPELYEAIQNIENSNPELFEKLKNAESDEAAGKIISHQLDSIGEEFKEKLKQKFIDDGTYMYGKWVTDNEEEGGYINYLTRVIGKVKGSKKTTITKGDVRNSVREFFFLSEIRKLIIKDMGIITLDQQNSKIGEILCYLTNSGLLKETDLPNIKDRKSNVKKQFMDFKLFLKKDTYQHRLSPDNPCKSGKKFKPNEVLKFLGLNTIAQLPIELVSVKKESEAYKYENTFAESCVGNVESFLVSGLGDKSRLMKRYDYVKFLGELIDKQLLLSNVSDEDKVDNIVEKLVKEGFTTDGIKKFDLITLTDVTVNDTTNPNNTIVISSDTAENSSKIEVKRVKYNKKGGFHLSEFFGLYKHTNKEQRNEEIERVELYNKVIVSLVDYMNKNDIGVQIIEHINNTMTGIFFSDYIYLPQSSYVLSWSSDSRGDEKRLTIRVNYIEGESVYKWVEGNCNSQQNESTDRIDNIVENFFDTGNFDI
tara:strand:+ start:2 stop:1987 length:1986 start_codon:yes stop_codon:yes gene_type:complete